MGITVLGPLTVDGAPVSGRRDRVVLAALATRPGRPFPADQLIDALWGDQPPASAPKILQGCIVRLRKLLGADAIATGPHGYVLTLPPDQVDAERFASGVARARELLTLGEADRAAYLLSDALALWRGDAFTDLEEWPPAASQVRRLQDLRLDAEELHVEACLRSGRHREVLAEVQALVRAAPLRERRWAQLALAEYQSGNQGEALRVIHQLKSVLLQQLGIDPSPDVVALEQAILRQDESLLTGTTNSPATASCPWQGLLAYDVDDADRFFGRDDAVDACLEILRQTSVLALVGPSGSGKSSILRAGVAAALRARGRPIVTITPGRHPLDALSALGEAGPGTVLLVDQCEELFSLCEDPAEQQQFLRALTEEAGSRTVLLALRADHLADVATSAGFSRLVERGLYLVGGLSEEGLQQAIEGPARQAGLVIEPGLVDLLVQEVKDDPGALPLLSHALLETWKRREGSTLTVAGYRASGGIHHAISQSAERLYAQIDVGDRHLMKDLVLRLVSPGLQGEPVRSRVPRRLVATDDEREQVIEMLIRARLVTSDDGVLEISHEALARAWPRLRGWLDDDLEGQRMLHHLASAADAWDTLGRPDSELYRGVRLARTLDWQEHTRTALTDNERAFLDAARRSAEVEEQSAAERARVQARLIRRLRVVLAGAVVLLVLALAAGGVAGLQTSHARSSAAAARTAQAGAEKNAVAAEARQAAIRAVSTSDIDGSVLLAAAAMRLEDSPSSLNGLTQVLAQHPALIDSAQLPGAGLQALDVSPGGRTVATIDEHHLVTLVDRGSGDQRTYQAGPARAESIPLRTLQFSPDGRTLAVGGTAGSRPPVLLLDGRTLAPLPQQLGGLPPGRWQVADVSWAQDGRSVAAGLWRLEKWKGDWAAGEAIAAVWRLDRPSRPAMLDVAGSPTVSPDYGYLAIALSPHGNQLYVVPDARVYDVRSGTSHRFTRVKIGIALGGVAVSPDGRLVVISLNQEPNASDISEDYGALLVDAHSGREVRRIATNQVADDFRFSDRGDRLMTTGWGNLRPAQVWDVASGRLLGSASMDAGSHRAVDLTPDGRTVISAGWNGSLRTWDLSGTRGYLRQVTFHGPMPSACMSTPSPDARFVAYAVCGTGALKDTEVLLDVARRRTHLVRHANPGWWVGNGGWDGPRYLHASEGIFRLLDARDGTQLHTAHPLGDKVIDVVYTPDRRRVVAAEVSGRVTLLDSATFRPTGRSVELDHPALLLAAGPDDSAFVVYGGTGPTKYWNRPADKWALVDLRAGTIRKHGTVDVEQPIWAAASADGSHAVVTGATGQVEILDLGSGRPVRPTLQAHATGTYWAAFSPDGSQLVTTALNGSVVLWDTHSAEMRATVTVNIAGQEGWQPNAATFRPDGRTLLIAPQNGRAVYMWDPSAERAMEFACRMAGRDLTETEWADNFPDQPYRQVCPEK